MCISVTKPLNVCINIFVRAHEHVFNVGLYMHGNMCIIVTKTLNTCIISSCKRTSMHYAFAGACIYIYMYIKT
jgi:hypothetical protein